MTPCACGCGLPVLREGSRRRPGHSRLRGLPRAVLVELADATLTTSEIAVELLTDYRSVQNALDRARRYAWVERVATLPRPSWALTDAGLIALGAR